MSGVQHPVSLLCTRKPKTTHWHIRTWNNRCGSGICFPFSSKPHSIHLLPVHVSGSSAGASQLGVGASATSRSDTPSSSGELKTSATANGSAGTGSSTPTSVKVDGTTFLDCVSCGRQASLHLSSRERLF